MKIDQLKQEESGVFFHYSYLKHGCLIFFFNDVSDAFLETGKLFVYANNRGGKTRKWGEVLTNFLFGLFTVTW